MRAILYASLGDRLVAYALDCTLLFAGVAVSQTALYPINPIVAMLDAGRQPTPWQLHGWVFATVTLPFVAYFALCTAGRFGGTVGMRRRRLVVTTMNGDRIGLGRAVLRSAALLVPFELNHTALFHLAPGAGGEPSWLLWGAVAGVWALIGLYCGLVVVSTFRQSVHDLVARCVVLSASQPSQSRPG